MFRVILIALAFQCIQIQHVAAQTKYTVDDAINQMQSSIRTLLMPEVSPEIWLSLTTIGAVAERGDQKAINELANFCPQPSATITAFGGIRPLDQVYEKAISSMIGPKPLNTAAVKEAKDIISDESKYDKYKSYLDAAAAFQRKALLEKDSAALPVLFQEYKNLLTDWRVRGFKDEIEGAFFTIDTNEGLFGQLRNQNRKYVLEAYKANGLTAIWQVGSFNSPLSTVSPSVDDWGKESGWVSVGFDSSTYNKTSSSSSSSSSGGGFLHIGGLVGGGTSGGGNSSSTSSSDVKYYAYTFEVKRIRIIRDWLDYRVFGTVGGWAWKKVANMSQYPVISTGISPDNAPIKPEFTVYDNSVVECPMIPTELVIARNISVKLTTSKPFFEQVNTAGSSGGGGMFGGIIGGSKKSSWSTSNVTASGDDVTFTVEAPGIAVIGLISQLVGRIPAPDPANDWPEDAWLEGDQ